MHKITFCVVIFLKLLNSVQNNVIIKDNDDVHKLPPVYYGDPYESCIKNQNVVCRVSIKLNPINATHPSKLWKLIEETKNTPHLYSRDQLVHLICIDKNYRNSVKEYSEKLYTEKYIDKGLTASVTDIECNNSVEKYTPLNFYDFVTLAFFSAYLIFSLICSLFDNHFKNDTMKCFSISRNFFKILESHNTKNDKLSRIQALRFYTNLWVIFTHTLLGMVIVSVANIEFIEKYLVGDLYETFRFFISHVVQIFFLMSGWFMSYQTYIILSTKNITLNRYMFLAVVKRFSRLIPHVTFIAVILTSRWFYLLFPVLLGAPIVDRWYENCQKNWWTLPLSISNHYDSRNMCSLHLWYLSADTQLYVISLIFLILGIKFKRRILFFVLPLLAGISITSVKFYNNNIDILFKITPDFSVAFLKKPFSDDFLISHTSTYANMATYSIGTIFGYIHFRLGNKILFNTKFRVVLWYFSFFGIPTVVGVIFCNSSENEIIRALLGGICKPLFAIGIGIGILGLISGIENFIEKVFDWKFAQFLGDFTYSTYITHVLIIFLRHVTIKEPRVLTESNVLLSILVDIFLSFFLGFVFYLLAEMPLIQLHNAWFSKYFSSKVENRDPTKKKFK